VQTQIGVVNWLVGPYVIQGRKWKKMSAGLETFGVSVADLIFF